VLLRAFEALREHVPAELTSSARPTRSGARCCSTTGGVERPGQGVDDERKRRALRAADVLCAPSLGGESFGMVLTEAFAAGTPVVASDIAGYRDVVRDGEDGILVPRGDATEMAEALRDLWLEPKRRAAMGVAAFEHAGRYAWPRVAAEVLEVYDQATSVPASEGRTRRAAVRAGVLPADGLPRAPAKRLPKLEPARVSAGDAPPRHPAVPTPAAPSSCWRRWPPSSWARSRYGGSASGTSDRRFCTRARPGFSSASGSCARRWSCGAVAWHAILRAALPAALVKRRTPCREPSSAC
jgi:phosphatidylinositol alpha-mannosyltransferase